MVLCSCYVAGFTCTYFSAVVGISVSRGSVFMVSVVLFNSVPEIDGGTEAVALRHS